MTPAELLAECDRPGPLGSPRPRIYLVLERARPPQGRGVRLFGPSGPAGVICNVRETVTGFDVVAIFETPAVRAAVLAAFPELSR